LVDQAYHAHRDWGFGLCFAYIRNVKGFQFNHKRVYRIYCELALNLRIKPKRRIKRPVPEVLKEPEHTNDIWSLDFMHDQMSDGQSYRLLNVIDDYKREGLAMEVGLSLPASRVIRTLNQILEYRNAPNIRCDNGPEFTSHEFQAWADKKASGLNTFNLANRNKTLILSVTIVLYGMDC
jgi:putative transposase